MSAEMCGWRSSMWNAASRDEMARGWNWETLRVDRAPEQWMMVPIISVGWWTLGASTRGTLGVMLPGRKSSSEDVGNTELYGVLNTGFLVLMKRLRRGICGMKSSA